MNAHRTRRIATLVLGAALVATAAASARADSKRGFRQLTSTHPVAVQRGTTAQVRVRANFTLDGAFRVLCDKPGVEMTYAETKPIEAYTQSRSAPGVPFRFDVVVSPDAPLGLREFRVATPIAVSSAGCLHVTELPVVVEDEKRENGAPAAAQSVTWPAAVCGVCDVSEDVDCFRLAGRAGQDLTCEILAQRTTDGIHSMVVKGPRIYLMDPIITLFGPNGQVVAQNDNFFGGDSLLSCRLPSDGDYVLEVRDARYAGDPRYAYCVEITDRPPVHAVFPPAVRRGTETTVEPIGWTAGDVPRVRLALPADEPLGRSERRLALPTGETRPLPVIVSDHPQLVVDPAHASAESPLDLALPVGINGRFARPEETHHLRFAAKKGEVLRFEIQADRLGLPTDVVLEILDDKGKPVAEADDGLQTKDPRLFFVPKTDGTFVLLVRELHSRHGERFAYHLHAEPALPDFELHGEFFHASLGPGTHAIWFARVERLAGFAGPVEIRVDGLPPGVTQTPLTIPAGLTEGAVILSAAPDAKLDAALVSVLGTARVPGPDGTEREIVRRGRVTTEQQGSGGGQSRWPVRTSAVCVTAPGDLLEVVAEPTDVRLAPGGSAEIRVRIVRNADFADPVTLSMAFDYFAQVFGNQLPPGVTLGKSSRLRLSGPTLEGTIVLEAAPKAAPIADWPIAPIARVPVSFSVTTNYASNPLKLTIDAPDATPVPAKGAAGKK